MDSDDGEVMVERVDLMEIHTQLDEIKGYVMCYKMDVARQKQIILLGRWLGMQVHDWSLAGWCTYSTCSCTTRQNSRRENTKRSERPQG